MAPKYSTWKMLIVRYDFSKYYYSAADPACLAPSANVRKDGVGIKWKQSALKVGTKS